MTKELLAKASCSNHGIMGMVSTNQRVNELYQFMWSRVPVMLTMYFLQGADVMRFARIAGIDERVTGEYIYHFIW
ncbi:hypothetical protein [Bacillus paramycoides]|uniref:hypothetical protein n=1 Tax=Bacillus paramycoides TaxID=2026194 RepID=UPI003D01D544